MWGDSRLPQVVVNTEEISIDKELIAWKQTRNVNISFTYSNYLIGNYYL